MAQRAVKELGASIQVACQAFRISQACYRYEAKHQADNEVIADWLVRLTDICSCWNSVHAVAQCHPNHLGTE
jgi:putative transposase